MRRSEREIVDHQQIKAVILRAQICHLGMIADGWPYVVPMNYGYHNGILYLHSARTGLKIEALQRDPRVCFEIETDVALLTGRTPCECGMRYCSVIGRGIARFLYEPRAKAEALGVIMSHYQQMEPHEHTLTALERTMVIAVDILTMTGKQANVEPSQP